MLTHAQLLADVDDCRLNDNQCALWWLGQQSYILKLGGQTVFLDPYLSPSKARNVEPMLDPTEIAGPQIVTGTHLHSDHIDCPIWTQIAENCDQVQFILPEAVKDKTVERTGIAASRLIGLTDGQSIEINGVKISAIPSAHELLHRDDAGRYPFLGYIFQYGSCTVYHAGDTCIYEGIQDKLRQHNPDVMLLPINGRDAERYLRPCLGNMTYQEAVDLAGTLEPKLTIPGHFDMFDGNRENPQLFIDYMAAKYPHLKTMIPQYGERLVVDCTK